MNAKRGPSLRVTVAALILATACGSDDNRTLRIIKGAALQQGVITGFVIDDETELPVRAEILVGGTPVRARPDGSFEVPATAGRVRVEVRAEGYLKTFRDVAVGGKSLPMPFKVARRMPKKVVGPMGGKIAYRDATLEVPSGAFVVDTLVSLTHLSRVRVAAIAATPQFIDDQGIPRRAVALVDLAADDAPSMPVRARVPVPGDATMETTSGYVIDGQGNWSTPISPDTVGGGFAEFVLTGDLQIGVAVDARKADNKRIGYLVTDHGDTSAAQGDVLTDGELSAGAHPAAIVDPQGSRVELAPGTRARVEVPPDMPVATRAPYAGTVAVTAGRARVVVPPPPADAPKLIKLTLKGNAGQFDVKGTAFSVTTCGFPPNVIDVVEVGEGVVGASAGTEKKDVAAGETATVCTDCSPAAIAMCTPPDSDGGAVVPEDDGGAPASPDGGSVEGGGGMMADAGAPGDAGAVGNDAPVMMGDAPGPAPDVPVVQPDGPPPPDAAVKVDVTVMPDAAAPTPDMAAPMPDTAAPTPDMAPPTPDMAPPTPDMAPPTPDMAPPMPDMAPPMPDMAPPMPDMAPPMPDAAPPMPDASAAMFTINPGKWDYGQVTMGVTSPTVNFTVTNVGDLPSGVPAVTITGDFTVTANGCMNAVSSGTSCIVGAAFKPGSTGPLGGALTVDTGAGSSVTASLSGTGVAPQPAQFSIKPASVNFGYKQMNRATGDVAFVVTNTGGSDSAIPKYSIGGKDPTDFAFNAGAPRVGFCPNPLPKGGTCTISLHFAPKSANGTSGVQPKTATLDVTGTPGGTATSALAGTATLATGGLEIEPPHIDLGSVPVQGISATQTFTVRNIGPAGGPALGSLQFMLSVPHAAAQPEFAWNAADCAQKTLVPPPGTPSSCAVTVTYHHLTFTGLRQQEIQVAAHDATGAITGQAAAHVQATAQ